MAARVLIGYWPGVGKRRMKKTQNAKDAKVRLLTKRRKTQKTQKLASEWRTKTQKC